MSFSSHALAAKRAAVLAIATTSIISASSFAAGFILPTTPSTRPIDANYANVIVRRFAKPGATTPMAYSNQNLETSGFDFPAYVSNTCFKPTENDKQFCMDIFGPYANLQETMRSGDLFAILVNAGVLSANNEGLVAGVHNAVATKQYAEKVAATMVDVATVQDAQRQDRSATIWEICKQQFADAGSRAACFQRNHRLIDRFDVAVEGNIL